MSKAEVLAEGDELLNMCGGKFCWNRVECLYTLRDGMETVKLSMSKILIWIIFCLCFVNKSKTLQRFSDDLQWIDIKWDGTFSKFGL